VQKKKGEIKKKSANFLRGLFSVPLPPTLALPLALITAHVSCQARERDNDSEQKKERDELSAELQIKWNSRKFFSYQPFFHAADINENQCWYPFFFFWFSQRG